MIEESQRIVPCGCKCPNCKPPIPMTTTIGEPQSYGDGQIGLKTLQQTPNEAKKRDAPMVCVELRDIHLKLLDDEANINGKALDQSNGREKRLDPSVDTVILDLAIAGESFCRIARYLGANVNAVRERYDQLLREQCELLKYRSQQSGIVEAKSKKPEKESPKSNKNEAKEKAANPDGQKAKGNAKEGGKSTSKPRPRCT
jgi:hypothetical protein